MSFARLTRPDNNCACHDLLECLPGQAGSLIDMDISLKGTRFALARDGLIALRDARGARITCLEGALWVTQEGSIKDEVLAPGQTLRVRHDGTTLITALAPSVLLLSEERRFATSIRGTLRQRLAAMLQKPLANRFGVPAARDSRPDWRNRDSRWGSDHFIRAF